MRILLCEDTADLAEGLIACLKRMGHAVDWASDGETADHMLKVNEYDLAVLDLMVPEMDGVTVLRRLRKRRSETGVLIITARAAIEDRVDVLDVGADDYLVKPFDFREFEARVRSLLRRGSGERSSKLSCEGLSFDRTTRMAKVNGHSVVFSRRELSLLEVLLANSQRITSKSALLEQLFDHTAEPNENAIELLISRIRPKIVGSGAVIRTYRGLGYRLESEIAEGGADDPADS